MLACQHRTLTYMQCRLLFHRIKPIFVFDGETPALKRRTLIARRRCLLRALCNILCREHVKTHTVAWNAASP